MAKDIDRSDAKYHLMDLEIDTLIEEMNQLKEDLSEMKSLEINEDELKIVAAKYFEIKSEYDKKNMEHEELLNDVNARRLVLIDRMWCLMIEDGM